MALNKTESDIRDRRRKLVAKMMVRRPRITQRQIRQELTEKGFINPDTGEPWSIGTINRDVEAIRERARNQMDRHAREWRARELEMLRQLQADAWDEGNYRTVVSISKRRAKLLGLDEPEELDVDMGTDPETVETLLDALEPFPEARQAAAEALDKEGR